MDFSFLLNLLNIPKDPSRRNSNVLIASACINHRRPNFFVSMTNYVDCQKCVQFCFGCRNNTSHNNICSSVRHLKKENDLGNIHKYYLPLIICVIYNIVVDVTISISHGKYPKSHRGPYHN